MTMHWHGMQQIATPWSDGMPGLTQYPIPVCGHFVYNFTFMKLASSPEGYIFIRPNSTKPKPFNQLSNDTAVLSKLKAAELNAHLLSVYDYEHYASGHWMEEWEHTEIEQLGIDNIITSGKGQKPLTKKGRMCPNDAVVFPYPGSQQDTVSPAMQYNCTNSSTPFQVFTVNKTDGWATFNLLDLRVSIVSHRLYFLAADGHYTNIQEATFILVPIGERYQYFVKLDQPVNHYPIRTTAVVMSQLITGYAIMSYNIPKADPTKLPTAKHPWVDYEGNIINGGVDLVMSNLSPFPALPPPQGPANVTLNLNVTRIENSDGCSMRAFAGLMMLDESKFGYGIAFTTLIGQDDRLEYYVDLPAGAFASEGGLTLLEDILIDTTGLTDPHHLLLQLRTRRLKVAERLCHREGIRGRATVVVRHARLNVLDTWMSRKKLDDTSRNVPRRRESNIRPKRCLGLGTMC
ncbi:hypothetical protein FRC08_009906 [Ceratobasidium sp. 394]|nr:hypothetical protein FRC08_009906 [Ceratobasidium sp. 394]